MTFADLFVQRPKKLPVAEGAEVATLHAIRGEGRVIEGNRHTLVRVRENPRVQPSAPSAIAGRPPLVPINVPFAEGARYREAGATEAATRLDLYIADDSGPWIRRAGVLQVVK